MVSSHPELVEGRRNPTSGRRLHLPRRITPENPTCHTLIGLDTILPSVILLTGKTFHNQWEQDMRRQSKNVSEWRCFLLCGAVVATAIVCITPGIGAATIHVPTDQPTIQAGIDAGSESDTVLVAPGTYTGPGNYNILMDGKGMVVRSESGPSVTIIDCEGNGKGFILQGPMMFDPVIDGITVRNGYYAYSGGGGIRAIDCSPAIRSCVFASNGTGNQGGGAVYGNGAALFEDCIFANNTAASKGRAIEWENEEDQSIMIQFLNCTFIGNSGSAAAYSHDGYVLADFINCVFTENSGELFYFQAAGAPSLGSITLECCNIFGNEPHQWYIEPEPWYPSPTIAEQA